MRKAAVNSFVGRVDQPYMLLQLRPFTQGTHFTNITWRSTSRLS